MMAQVKGAVRRLLRVGDEPDPAPVVTPFMREMKLEQRQSLIRRHEHRQATRDFSRTLAPPLWRQGRD